MQIKTVRVKEDHAKDLANGRMLLLQDEVTNPEDLGEEGDILRVVSESGTYVGKGYYGRQNKGIGWLLTRQADTDINQSFFDHLIGKAIGLRAPFYQDESTDAFRLFNGEGDGIGGLVVDYYAGNLAVHWYSEGIYQLKPMILDSLIRMTGAVSIYEKRRFATDGQYVEGDDYVWGERQEFPLIVRENGVNIAVDLNDGAMTGVFLDQRDVRKAVMDHYAQGQTVLNTFSYTGVFSVFASLGGASTTTSVDVAARSKDKTIEQFAMNGIDPDDHHLIVQDVFDYMTYARKKGLRYGMVILDPPSFARAKKRTFSAAKDYGKLVGEALELTEENGIIVASTNHGKISPKKFRRFVDEAFQEAGIRYEVLETFSLPDDFRYNKQDLQSNYLKVLIIRRKD
ncbi:class I SAM-dependent rRNA methyltransferase [Salisediminibacterium halotolerans]|uniref:class I SAM-dependent rRNA methyltransferase n=1 Tax=Salisediminibacterium halotolerans TaxID=517425 RepID=UPI000EAB96A0|nr:class I SAM-dependent rRNA methyltransferase [Salisediminibacterium halotolerans]RLJ69676.1 SAM-dependent methyltransferase [Actinophytocola xinjiangensis]RPE89734.1 SAM-dependent methyltransferase [Salisediminibacterium halotolerans]TWG32570.1 SAM-dependent methyltransferase [Salisediminibacterium halotolerans]GEL08069.1 methyltransferase [Salisediminibacterium halotolerans]